MSNNDSSKASDAWLPQRANWPYVWLLVSTFIAVPAMFFSQSLNIRNSITRFAWSPDGTRIAFVSNHKIDVMNADGSHQTRLTNDQASYDYPVWSPDSARIAFVSGYTAHDIYVMNPDGSRRTRLTNNGASWQPPAWSPDGTRIAFVSEAQDICVMSADGSQQTYLAGGGSLAWSSDGKRIAFVPDRDGKDTIYVMNADGSQQTRLTDNGLISRNPIWSPDGKRLVFESNRDGNWDIYVINADGSQPTRLTDNKGYSPAWSPDGSRIAFISARNRNDEIYVMNTDGSQQTRLATTDNLGYFAWLPDGTRIAFISNRDGYDNIYVMNTDGTRVVGLIKPSLSPLWLGILLPALLHLILIAGLISPQLYVRRHTQQAIILIGLRIASSLLFIGLVGGASGVQLWILVNGSLWLFGSLWGIGQVRMGDCWLMRLRGEKDLLPRFVMAQVAPLAAIPSVLPSAPQVVQPISEPIATVAPVPVFSVPNDPSAALELGLTLVTQGKREQAIKCLMFVFRNGSPELRQHAIAEMEKLGEVEG